METNLRIPGPTPIPPQVREALSRQMINHRGPEFAEIIARVTENLKNVFQTKNDILIFPSAGTGMMEATVINVCSPGDTVVVVTIGTFGERYANIARNFGLTVVTVAHDAGHGAHLKEIEKVLKETNNIKAVFVTHNETSTGVTNDLEKIAKLVKSYELLLVVDLKKDLCVLLDFLW
jgi:aspartate aminotransferase-like enzyme